MELSPEKLDLVRQWYHAVLDTNSRYLETADHALAAQIMRQLGWDNEFGAATLRRAELAANQQAKRK